MKKYKLKLDWIDSEKSQLQTLKREETFNQANLDVLLRLSDGTLTFGDIN